MNVLITDDSYKGALGIVRSLGQKGIRVSVLSNAGSIRLASQSRYCSARYVVPPLDDDSALPAVIELLESVAFDLVIPVGYQTTAWMARHRGKWEHLTRMEIGDYDQIREAADKTKMHALAEAVGVPTPKTVLPAGMEDAAKLSAEFRYPVVLKAWRETPGAQVYYPRTREELLEIYRSIYPQADGNRFALPLIQEFVPGFGCGFFALYDHGECKRIFMHRRLRETPPSGGASCCARSFHDPTLQAYGTKLLDRLKWHGVAMAEFRYDERSRDYKLMEINPKFWGSLDLALAAGVDFPYYLCQMARGQKLEFSSRYNRNLVYHWPFMEVQHLCKRPASLWAVLADSFNPRVKSNLDMRDPKPNFLEPFSRVRNVVRHWTRGNGIKTSAIRLSKT